MNNGKIISKPPEAVGPVYFSIDEDKKSFKSSEAGGSSLGSNICNEAECIFTDTTYHYKLNGVGSTHSVEINRASNSFRIFDRLDTGNAIAMTIDTGTCSKQ
jgi:hypothetical protein